MPRFLIEIHHSNQLEGCIKSLHAIMNYGSHLITNADFGCDDGVHAGWLVVDAESHDAARQLVPPPYRADARIVRLRRWTQEEIRDMLEDIGNEG